MREQDQEQSFIKPQASPVKTTEVATWDLVVEDMKQRDRDGHLKYGVRLAPNNGRCSLTDAYQEALDLVVYLRNELYEKYGR